MPGRLDGKVALITGAASGMGKVAASLFAHEGAGVVVADVTDEPGRSAVDKIERAGGAAAYVHADVAGATPREWSGSRSSGSEASTSSTTTPGSSRPTTARSPRLRRPVGYVFSDLTRRRVRT